VFPLSTSEFKRNIKIFLLREPDREGVSQRRHKKQKHEGGEEGLGCF
jgi:hypothetical protein